MKKWTHLTVKRIWALVSFLILNCFCLSYNQINYLYQSQTLKPLHVGPTLSLYSFCTASSRCSMMHLSLSYLVSWQAQQIFFFGLVSGPVETTYVLSYRRFYVNKKQLFFKFLNLK